MKTHTVSVPGATLTYDIRDGSSPGGVPLVFVASPMDATGFATLSTYFPDRTIVTYDPRNSGRSVRDDPTSPVTPEQHADDLHAVIGAVGAEAVDVFASSGGAINSLALVARYPDDIRLLVAHEPPAGGVLPDRDAVRAACDDMVATYQSSGQGPATAKFINFVMQRGEISADYLAQPAPDPAAFGLPTEDDGDRTDSMMTNMQGGVAAFTPDVDALRAASTKVFVAVGEESGGPTDGEMAGRAAYAVAAALGTEAVVFPSHHAGFMGGEFGQTGQPAEFAAKLRTVMS
ncbi:alpha/beta fold hydrolase [Williamsia soli]|uniref:alpha/beta fold hydrolase n=1 Tax=Williamsia soli TaxID=364929 RepID=UPI001A9DC8B0|nr:alpha/beta hydrolase [Williamsia soli]